MHAAFLRVVRAVCDARRTRFLFRREDGEGKACTLEPRRAGGDDDFPFALRRTDHRQQLSGKQAAGIGLVSVQIGAVAVVKAQEHAARYRDADAVAGVVHGIPFCVDGADFDEGHVMPIAKERFVLRAQDEAAAVPGCDADGFEDNVSVCVIGAGHELARLKRNAPARQAKRSVCKADALSAQGFSVEEQLCFA